MIKQKGLGMGGTFARTFTCEAMMKRLLLGFLLVSLCSFGLCAESESAGFPSLGEIEKILPGQKEEKPAHVGGNERSKGQQQVRGLPTREQQASKREMIIQKYRARYGEEPLQREVHMIQSYPDDRIDQRMTEVRQMRLDSDKRSRKR